MGKFRLCRAPRSTTVSLQAGIVDNLRAFQNQHKMKKAALQIIAGQLSEEKIKALREIFVALDANGDGCLAADELRDGMAKASLGELLSKVDLDAIIEGVDADGSGMIDYTEFLAATLDRKCYLQEDVCYNAFSVFDQDGDGQITLEELKTILDNGTMDENALGSKTSEDILKAVDANGDGSIDFQVTVVTNTRTAASSARCFSFTSDTGCTRKPPNPRCSLAPSKLESWFVVAWEDWKNLQPASRFGYQGSSHAGSLSLNNGWFIVFRSDAQRSRAAPNDFLHRAPA
eukprot:s2807_g7.t1